MAGPFKPVGIDTDNLFPPRVEERLAEDFATAAISGDPGRFRGIYATAPGSLPDAQVGDWIIVTGGA